MLTRIRILKRGTPLASSLPGAQFAEYHSRILNAAPDAVWGTFHTLSWRDLRVTKPLMAIRLPSAIGGVRRRLVEPPSPAAPIFEDEARYSTSGMIGRPWKPRPELGPVVENLEQLAGFDQPGWLKYGMEWVLTPLSGGRTLVETATICEATDVHARRRFGAYWFVIRVFSGLIRRDILRRLDPAPIVTGQRERSGAG